MPNPYDRELRKRAVMAYERGEGSYMHVAALFDLNHRTLERWVARWRVPECTDGVDTRYSPRTV